MSVTELAERRRTAQGHVAYHVDVLVDAGLLQVVRTRKVRAIDERFYGRVARTIVFPQRTTARSPSCATSSPRSTSPGWPTMLSLGFHVPPRPHPRERAAEFAARLEAFALEFIGEPRGGDVEYGLYLGAVPDPPPRHDRTASPVARRPRTSEPSP